MKCSRLKDYCATRTGGAMRQRAGKCCTTGDHRGQAFGIYGPVILSAHVFLVRRYLS